MHGGDIIAILLAFFYSKLGSTAKYLANPPCKDEPTDADQEDKEAELLVTRSQCVNNRLHNKPIYQLPKYILTFESREFSKLPGDQGNGELV